MQPVSRARHGLTEAERDVISRARSEAGGNHRAATGRRAGSLTLSICRALPPALVLVQHDRSSGPPLSPPARQRRPHSISIHIRRRPASSPPSPYFSLDTPQTIHAQPATAHSPALHLSPALLCLRDLPCPRLPRLERSTTSPAHCGPPPLRASTTLDLTDTQHQSMSAWTSDGAPSTISSSLRIWPVSRMSSKVRSVSATRRLCSHACPTTHHTHGS